MLNFGHKPIPKTTTPGIVVLGGHVQGYGIVRIYGQNNIPCIVVDKSRYNITRHSKYCVAFHKVGYDDLIEFLIKLGRQNKYKDWLLMPTDDYYVRLLSQNKTELDEHFTVTVDDWEVINIFFNKKNSYPLAQAAGLPVPKTFYPDSFSDVKLMSEDISFPCIIKPAIMLDFYRHFKKKVFVCNNRGELERNYLTTSTAINPNELLIQEIIPGSSEHQYSVGIFFDRDRSYNYLVARRKRQHPVDFGNATTYAETVDVPVLVEYAHKILSRAKFFGLCEVEFKFDERDKQYKFLEVNPRTWKWHLISQSADIPFLPSLYRYFTEGRPIIATGFKKAGWRDMVTDLPIILDMMRKGLYNRADKTKTASAVANPSDLRPFIFQLLYLPYLFFKR
jgi:predicted ATP-grasp superfamily ATP-dependent carboligase